MEEIKKDKEMEKIIDIKLKEILAKNKFWNKIYKTSPNPKIERYKAVADYTYLIEGDKNKKLRKYCDEMNSKESIYMQKHNKKQDLEYCKWWLKTYNPQNNMVIYLAKERIKKLEEELKEVK